MVTKKKYQKPISVNVAHNIEAGIGGAINAAVRMVARSATKAMKGGIDLTAEVSQARTLQDTKRK